MSGPIRIGVDVGGTFTKAVAIETGPLRLLAHTAVPTSHAADTGVAEGVAAALRTLLAELGEARGRVALVAFSTTQAMNALLEGDVGRVGVLGIGAAPDLRAARKRTQVGSVALAPGPRTRDRACVRRRDRRSRRAAGGRGARRPCRGRLRRRGDQWRPRRRRSGGRAAGGRPRAPAWASGMCRPRPHRRLRPRDAHGQRRREREHPPRRGADRRRGRGSSAGGGHRRAAARPPRRRRRHERRGLPPAPLLHDRLRARQPASRPPSTSSACPTRSWSSAAARARTSRSSSAAARSSARCG